MVRSYSRPQEKSRLFSSAAHLNARRRASRVHTDQSMSLVHLSRFVFVSRCFLSLGAGLVFSQPAAAHNHSAHQWWKCLLWYESDLDLIQTPLSTWKSCSGSHGKELYSKKRNLWMILAMCSSRSIPIGS